MAKRLREALTLEERQALEVIMAQSTSLVRAADAVGVAPLTFLRARVGDPLSEAMLLVIRSRLAARAA